MRNFIIYLNKKRIFKRLIPSLLKIIIKFYMKKYVIIKYKNLFFKLNLKNPIDREIFLKNEYEETNFKKLEEVIKKDDIKIFLDIGSHMGFYTINIAKKENMVVHSFEPIKTNFDQLSENIKINNFKNIEKYNVALSSKDSKVLMWVSDINKTGGYAIYSEDDKEFNKYDKNKIQKICVETKKGDNLLKLKNQKIAIKIDVERHEKEVLLGLEKLILNNKVFLQIEIFENMEKKVEDLLSQYNFIFISKNGKDFFYKNY